jgi:hypothetical protein
MGTRRPRAGRRLPRCGHRVGSENDVGQQVPECGAGLRRTFNDAVAEANRLPFDLAAYAWSSSAKTVNAIGAALEAGIAGSTADSGCEARMTG